MDASLIGELVALLTSAYGIWERRKRKKAEAEAKRTAKELDLLRKQAGTKASWEP